MESAGRARALRGVYAAGFRGQEKGIAGAAPHKFRSLGLDPAMV